MDLLRAALHHHRDTIVVVMTGNPSVTSSIEALRSGAWDYLPSHSPPHTSRCSSGVPRMP